MDPCVLDLDKRRHYPALDYWDPIYRGARRQLLLVPDFFYILASKEKIRIPLTHAAEMVPYDPNFGEFRIHYAGFFDPGFGYGSGDIRGARAVLEVRSYGVPCLLEDGQERVHLLLDGEFLPGNLLGRLPGSPKDLGKGGEEILKRDAFDQHVAVGVRRIRRAHEHLALNLLQRAQGLSRLAEREVARHLNAQPVAEV